MRKLILSLAATPLILGSIAVSAQAAEVAVAEDAGFNIFSDVKFKGELRPRYEFKDVENSGNDAGSSITNRTNLNFSAKLFEVDGLNGEMELNAVNDFGSLNQNNTDVAAENPNARISQANISYTGAGVTGIIGRKGVNLDNQRFIGTVGWKQQMQTYDLAAVAYGAGDFNIIGAYVYGVNGIKGTGYYYGRGSTLGVADSAGKTSGSTTSALVNASYKIANEIKLTGYAYLLGSLNDTYGLAATGKIAMGDSAKLNYRGEFAMQTKATLEHTQLQQKSMTDNVDAMYMNLDVGANISGFLVGLNYEVLGGADKDKVGGDSFQTHLATKHKFNGWADQFLTTPSAGLADLNIRGGYKFGTAGKIIGIYHAFAAAADGNNQMVDPTKNISAGDAYGQEFDIAYSLAVPSVNGLNLLVKGAMFMDDDKTSYRTKDTTLAWVQLDYKFSVK